jgi:hypothetical protein
MKLNGIAWAISRWSIVTQKQKTRKQVVAYVRKFGWLRFEQELRYWVEQAKPLGQRGHAPHPDR